MLCLSYSTTLKTINRSTADHNSLLVIWKNSLLEHLPVIYLQLFVMHTIDFTFHLWEPQDSNCDDFENASGLPMINHLGWKADVSEDNSDCSIDSLTDADQSELDDFLFRFGDVFNRAPRLKLFSWY